MQPSEALIACKHMAESMDHSGVFLVVAFVVLLIWALIEAIPTQDGPEDKGPPVDPGVTQ